MDLYGDLLAQKLAKIILPPTATPTTLEAIDVERRVDGILCTAISDQSAWQFILASTATAGTDVRVPNDVEASAAYISDPATAPGRWLRVGSFAADSLPNQLRVTAPTELTISAGGAVTVTQTAHKIDTAADGATDDLDTLTGTVSGEFYLIRPESASRDVVIRDTGGGTGNIRTPHAKSITLAELTDWALLVSDGTNCTVVAFRTAAQNGGGAGAMIGLLASLTTTDKATIVAALNEVNALAVAAIGAVKRTVTVGHADLTDAVNGEAQVINVGDVLPANAVVLAYEVNIATLFSGGGATAVKLDVGGTDIDAMIAQMDIFTGAATGALSPRTGVHAEGKFSAEQLVATFTPDGAHTLLALDAGALTINVWYFVLP